MMRRAAGSPRTAMIRRWVRGRWRAPSRSTSSARSPRSCCSAAWPAAVTWACRCPRTARRSSSASSPRRYRRYPRKRRSAAAVDDAALGQIVRGHFHGDGVSGEDADVVLAHLAGDMRGHHVAILQLHPKGRVGQGLDDLTFHLDRIFFGHSALNGLRGANWSTSAPLWQFAARACVPRCYAGSSGAPALCACSRSSPWNWLRGMVRAPRLARCRDGSWQSMTASWLCRQSVTRCASAALEASRSRLNIDSPKNTPPRRTPYSPPTSAPRWWISTLCAQPRPCSVR